MSKRIRKDSEAESNDEVHGEFIAKGIDATSETTQSEMNVVDNRSVPINGSASSQLDAERRGSVDHSSGPEAVVGAAANTTDARRKSFTADGLAKFRRRIVDGPAVGVHLCNLSVARASVSDSEHTDRTAVLHSVCDACLATAGSRFPEPRRIATAGRGTWGTYGVSRNLKWSFL